MEEAIARRLAVWLNDALPEVTVTNPVHIHLDELLERDIGRDEAVSLSIAAFRVLIHLLTEREMPVQPILILPLTPGTTELGARPPPNIHALLDDLDGLEPPSLYLSHWQTYAFPWIIEEYRVPLAFRLFDPPLAGRDVHFSELRTQAAIAAGWEFARSIRAWYYPPDRWLSGNH
jgi:hypothetical protein